LQNDIEIIKDAFTKILNSNFDILLVKGKEMTVENNEKLKKSKKDEEHPLLMDVLGKFDGQIIR